MVRLSDFYRARGIEGFAALLDAPLSNENLSCEDQSLRTSPRRRVAFFRQQHVGADLRHSIRLD